MDTILRKAAQYLQKHKRSKSASQTQEPALCYLCRSQDLASIAKHISAWSTRQPLGRWPLTHTLSNRKKCLLCAFLSAVMSIDGRMSQEGRSWEEDAGDVFLYIRSYDGEPGCRIHLQIEFEDDVNYRASVCWDGTLILTNSFDKKAPEIELPGAMPYLTVPVLGRKLEDVAAWPLARKWLNYCSRYHQHQGPPDQGGNGQDITQSLSNFRLIDIGKHCIVDAPRAPRYIALSYVWGGSKPIRLKSQNADLLMRKGGLAKVSDLPKTFRDAIIVTEQLHYEYLWIDALCIQHDDALDLTLQIQSMDKIYQEAALTIVSLTSNADSEIPGIRSGTRDSTSFQYTSPNVNLMYARPRLIDAIRTSDWNTRGWTLQERFFSKRLLYFTQHQVYYQCATDTWAEDTILEPQDFDDSLQAPRLEPRELQHVLDVFASPEDISWDSFFQYQDLLQDYMKRQLTHDSDILSAFSGILNSLETKLGLPVFGLPERIFDIALLWYHDPHATRRPQFPSWSWCGWANSPGHKNAEYVLSWLVVVNNLQGRTDAWVQPSQRAISNSSAEDRGAPRTTTKRMSSYVKSRRGDVVMPQPLQSIRTLLNTDPPSHLLVFQADTFYDEQYVREDVSIALTSSLKADSDQDNQPTLQFVVMSSSRSSDSWYKRRHGTFALPSAPCGVPREFAENWNLMLIKTNNDGISERIWVFSVVMERSLPEFTRKTIRLM